MQRHQRDPDAIPRDSACRFCRRFPCSCSDDLAADRWAKAHGVTLPREGTHARIGSGHLGDAKRGTVQEQLGRIFARQGGTIERLPGGSGGRGGADGSAAVVEAAPPQGHFLRHYRDWAVARLQAARIAKRKLEVDIRRLETQVDVIALKFDGHGKSVTEIGRVLGHGHPWVVEQLRRAAVDASGLAKAAPYPHACSVCGEKLEPTVGRGRPRLYHPRCGQRARDARRAAKNIPQTPRKFHGKTRNASGERKAEAA